MTSKQQAIEDLSKITTKSQGYYVDNILDGSQWYEIPTSFSTSWDTRRRLKKLLKMSTYDDVFRLTEWKKKLQNIK